MKKIIGSIVAVAAALSIAFIVSGCDANDNENHQHTDTHVSEIFHKRQRVELQIDGGVRQ